MQSPSSRHVRSTAQRSEHVSPPQSTSVSRPFLLWSTQETQLPSKHLPLAQSFGTRHALSLPQLSQNVPPQSTSVSSPSWAPDWRETQVPSKH